MFRIGPLPMLMFKIADESRQHATEEVTRIDPIPSFKFKVHLEIDGIIEGGFTECKGLDAKWKVKKYKEGGVNNFVHQLPERVEYSKVTLRRGLALSRVLWDWCMAGIHDGQVSYRNVSIILHDVAGNPVKQWDLIKAYPIKWTLSPFKADSKNVVIETLELAHHGIALNEPIATT